MEKEISISYHEQSKNVVASASIKYLGDAADIPSNDKVLEETQDLFDKAQRYSIQKSFKK